MEQQPGAIEKLLDNPIGLLILSNVVFFVVYFLWGIVKIQSIPPMPKALIESILGGAK
ncbi:MAG: hypothetical protein HQL61_04465 [Magnetococcales bacterium]|uniref:Uncharacterized protein n=1 Tax=Candidatus Magnetobacterium casense TaxID=1455061 RepID=A0ABS6RVN9_9BACT|nr:hypothetical protein [Candidatus Magnetobacterium casensis]MBF0606795.1 hypothetical protein [Nitrospirota bacterium]MBV6340420.1 hypothetical protein [Candidatus Magnetobacterium casensis]